MAWFISKGKMMATAVLIMMVMLSGSILPSIGQIANAEVNNNGTAPPNLIKNPDFEEPLNGGKIPKWSLFVGSSPNGTSGSGTASLEMIDPQQGQLSVKIETTDVRTAQLYQRVAVAEEKEYKLSYWVKSSGAEGMPSEAFVGVRLQFYGENNIKTADNVQYDNAAANTNWTRYEHQIIIPPGTVELEINLLLYRYHGAAWFDSLELKEQQVSLYPANLAVNGGFEEPQTGTAIPSWPIYYNQQIGHASAELSESGAKEGIRFVKLKADSLMTAQLYQRIAVESGKMYAVHYSAKVNQMELESAGTVGLRLQFFGDNNTKTADNMQVGDASDKQEWTRFAKAFTAPPGTKQIELNALIFRGKGEAAFDDVLFYEIDPLFPKDFLDISGISLESGAVKLEWDPYLKTEAPVEYSIHRSGSASFIPDASNRIGTVSDTFVYSDRSVAAGQTYYYKVVQMDEDIEISAPSEAAAVPVLAGLPEVQPVASFSAMDTINHTIGLYWTIDPMQRADKVMIYGADEAITEQNINTAIIIDDAADALLSEYVIDIDQHPERLKSNYAVRVKDADGNGSSLVSAQTYSFLPRIGDGVAPVEHPYLFASQQEIDAFKANISQYAWMATARDMILSSADQAASVYGSLTELYPVNDNRYNQMADAARMLSIAYALTEDETYAAAARHILLLFVEYYGNHQYVFSQYKDDGYLVFPLAWSYDFIYNSSTLSTADRDSIENGYFQEIAARLQKLSRGKLENQGTTNWSVGVIGFLLKDQTMLNQAFERDGYGLKYNMLNGIDDDGLWWEQTVGYHRARADYFTMLAEAAYHSNYDLYGYLLDGSRDAAYTGSDSFPPMEGRIINVEDKSIKELLDSLFYFTYSDLSFPALADADPQFLTAENMYELAYRRYGDPKYGWLLASDMGSSRLESSLNNYYSLFAAVPELPADVSFYIGNGAFNKLGINKLGSSLFLDSGAAFLRSKGDYLSSTNVALQWNSLGTTFHSHGDKLALTMYGAGDEILIDPGRYAYGSVGQKEFAKHTIAHNTLTVDEKSQYPYTNVTDEWIRDEPGRSSGGYLSAASIGPVLKLIQTGNDNVYADLDVSLNRTTAVIDDYVIDVFRANGNAPHRYDYPLTIDGTLESSSVPLTALNPTVPLGTANGYQHIKNVSKGIATELWSTVWNLGNDRRLRTTMLGKGDTEVIKADGLSRTGNYGNPMLIARRDQIADTAFVQVMEPHRTGAAARTITATAVHTEAGADSSADAVRIITPGKAEDLFMIALVQGMREAGALKSDGIASFKREESGKDTVLAVAGGKYVEGLALSIHLSVPSAVQLTYMAEDVYRFDFDGEAEATVTVEGLDQYNVYELALSDTKELSAVTSSYEGGSLSFTAQPGKIYIFGTQQSIVHLPQPDKVKMGKEISLQTIIPAKIAVIEHPLTGQTVEAEDFTMETGGNVTLAFRDGASHTTNNPNGNVFYGWDSKGHMLEWEVDVLESGSYRIMAAYATLVFNSMRTFEIDGGDRYRLHFPVTPGWNDRRNGLFQDTAGNDLLIYLEKGKHTIRMVNQSGALNLDRFVLEKSEGGNNDGGNNGNNDNYGIGRNTNNGGNEQLLDDEDKKADGVVLHDLEGHWAAEAIERAVELGLVNGYGDHTFRPQAKVTRAEFAVMMCRALQMEETRSAELPFNDAANVPAWAKGYVAQSIEAGIISGYGDHTFRPGKAITRSELAVMIARALKLPIETDSAITFADADQIADWAKPYVAVAAQAGVIKGKGNNRFAPNQLATRAEAVILILALQDRN